MKNRLKIHFCNALFLNTYLLIAMRFWGAAVGFIFWTLAARMMRADDLGLASGAISATMLLAGLAVCGWIARRRLEA